MRPKTLAEVAQLTRGGDSFDRCLAAFLDEFYGTPDVAALSATPELLAPKLGELGRVQDAYLAATAEQLACDNRLSVPACARSCFWKAPPLSARAIFSSARTH
jgi:hypothetical protein